MKNIKIITTLITALAVLTSCSKKEDKDQIERATAEEFSILKTAALEDKIQEFQFNANDTAYLTTENGVLIVINGSCLTNNGNPVSGIVDVEIVEIFNKGAMLTTNKPTMGINPNGDQSLLLSGGEFYINATQQENQLQLDCAMQLIIPESLTGGADMAMTLWNGLENNTDCTDNCDNLVWEEVDITNNAQNEGVEVIDGDNGQNYVALVGDFGWTNVDKFYTDPRPKTTLLVAVPDGFDNTNSAVYISFNGEQNALARLDTYIDSSELFSEHYGQIPIGLECHIIFTSDQDGNWLYAIQSATIVDGATITITYGELQTTNQNELETLINNLP